MQFTIQNITDNAIDLADMRNSQFIDQVGTNQTLSSELLRYVNLAYRDLYQQIVLSKEFYFTTTSTINVVGGTDTYALPTDFYKLDGVDMALDNSGRYLTLKPFMFQERNKFRSGLALTIAPYGQVFRYLLVGSNIRFLPIPSNQATIQMWYTPEPVVITSLSQTLNLPIGSDEYMSLYMACAMLQKEETDTTALDQKRLQVIAQICNSFKDRDQGSPSYVMDDSSVNEGALYPFRGNS
jgi:hypothetical protein